MPDDVHPGRSLFDIAAGADQPDRVVFSEYHATGAVSAGFMIRKERWKYNYYAGFEAPELYDLEADIRQTKNLYSEYPEVVRAVRSYLERTPIVSRRVTMPEVKP